MIKATLRRFGIVLGALVALVIVFGMGINYERSHSASTLQYFLRYPGQIFVSVNLPAGWNQETQSGQTPYTATYSAPSGSQGASLAIEAWGGASHNETNGTGAFDPAAVLPFGCQFNGQHGNDYTFSYDSGYEHGVIYTTPSLSGAIVLTAQSAQSSVWQTAVQTFSVNASGASHLLSALP